ncbi:MULTISPECIES: hypothetical protein [unclassified Ligilactobacillus]
MSGAKPVNRRSVRDRLGGGRLVFSPFVWKPIMQKEYGDCG